MNLDLTHRNDVTASEGEEEPKLCLGWYKVVFKKKQLYIQDGIMEWSLPSTWNDFLKTNYMGKNAFQASKCETVNNNDS